MLRALTRYSIILISIALGGLSCLLLLMSWKQINKNQKVLADMKDRVVAIRGFQKDHERLPTKNELEGISRSLPVRYTAYDYELQTSSNGMLSITNWPQSGGWALSFWRGEWTEYYTSWNEEYSLTQQASWWGFCGPLLFCPVVAVLLFFTSRLRVLQSKKPK